MVVFTRLSYRFGALELWTFSLFRVMPAYLGFAAFVSFVALDVIREYNKPRPIRCGSHRYLGKHDAIRSRITRRFAAAFGQQLTHFALCVETTWQDVE